MAEPSLKEKTAKSLFWMGLGNGVQQVLQAVFGIVLARILTNNDYGMVAGFAVYMGIANALQEGGFGAALINKKDIRHEDYNAVFWFSGLMGVVMYAILFFCAPLIAVRQLHEPALTPLMRYMFLSIIFSSLGTAQAAYLRKNLYIKQISLSSLVGIIISGICGIGMAMCGLTYWGLATQSLIFVASFNIGCWIISPWRPSWHVSFAPIREIFPFSVKILFTRIITQINGQQYSTILKTYFSAADTGNYSQADKWCNMGNGLITNMVNNVAQPVLSKASESVEYQKKVFRKMLRFTAFLSFPAMLGLAFIAPEFIVIAVTAKWADSARLMQLLCIGGAFIPVASLYWNLIITRGKSNIYMWSTLVLALSQLTVALLMWPYGVTKMVEVYVCLNIAWMAVWHYFAQRLIGLTTWEAAKDIAPFALATAAAIAVAYFATRGIENLWLLMLAKIGLVAVLYVLIMKLSHAVVFDECVAYLLQKWRNKKQKKSTL